MYRERMPTGVCVYQVPHIPFRAIGVAWPHSPAHWRPRHRHREPELNVVTSGRGQFALDTGGYELGRGQVTGFVPHVGHELIDATADFDRWVVAFRPDLVDRVDRERDAVARALGEGRGPHEGVEPF